MSRGHTVANSVQEIRASGLALIDDSGPDRTSLGTWILQDPEKVMVAATAQAIAETLAEVDQTRADLHWVALLNYELGFWFEPKLFHDGSPARLSSNSHLLLVSAPILLARTRPVNQPDVPSMRSQIECHETTTPCRPRTIAVWCGTNRGMLRSWDSSIIVARRTERSFR